MGPLHRQGRHQLTSGRAPARSAKCQAASWVSAGPYRLTKVERDRRYVLERVDSFGPATPSVKEGVLRVFPDVNTEVLALRSDDRSPRRPALAGPSRVRRRRGPAETFPR
ncbi:hypothetical protein, partial [Streptosporangium carneum]|uniref:hypothetical protein n=1 Tax=Streptosporangium carneum TaxID=47481 RepID=UPI003CD0712A